MHLRVWASKKTGVNRMKTREDRAAESEGGRKLKGQEGVGGRAGVCVCGRGPLGGRQGEHFANLLRVLLEYLANQ